MSSLSREAKGNFTILAVDDNDALRYSLSRTLQGEGYKVIEARNAAEALDMAEASPDLITLDVNLPDRNGFEVCRLLKTNPLTAHIPVLHISSTFVDTEDRIRGLESADGYLAEPVSRDELLATVGALLRLKQAEREARRHADEAERAKEELKQAHDNLELRIQQRTMEIEAQNQVIRELSSNLLNLQDDERRRISRELHDSTGQMLAAMKMNLDRLRIKTQGSDLESLIAETIVINDDLSGQLRTMSYLLHPPLLDETGLNSALKWYTDGFSERSGIAVQLEIAEDFGRLSDDMEITIFRLVQECLTNIHRHSGSKSAVIELSRNNSNVLLDIQDEGHGVPVEKMAEIQAGRSGVGIAGMRERVHYFEGELDIQSTKSGTRVFIKLPNAKPESENPKSATRRRRIKLASAE